MAAELQRPPPTALIFYLEWLSNTKLFHPTQSSHEPEFKRQMKQLISDLEPLSKIDQLFRFKQLYASTIQKLPTELTVLGQIINSCLAGSQLSLFELYHALKIVSQNHFTPERGTPITSVYNFLYGGNNGAIFVILDSQNNLRGIHNYKNSLPRFIECKHQGFTVSESYSLTADEIADSTPRRFLSIPLPSGNIFVIKPDLANPLFSTKICRLREVEPVLKYTEEDYFESKKRGGLVHSTYARCEQTEPTPVFELVPLSVKELNDMLPLLDGRPRALPVEAGVASLAATPADLAAPVADAVPFSAAEARIEGGKTNKKKRNKKNRKSRKNKH